MNPDWGGRRYPPVNVLPTALEERILWSEYGIGIDHLDDNKRELLIFRELYKRFSEIWLLASFVAAVPDVSMSVS